MHPPLPLDDELPDASPPPLLLEEDPLSTSWPELLLDAPELEPLDEDDVANGSIAPARRPAPRRPP